MTPQREEGAKKRGGVTIGGEGPGHVSFSFLFEDKRRAGCRSVFLRLSLARRTLGSDGGREKRERRRQRLCPRRCCVGTRPAQMRFVES